MTTKLSVPIEVPEGFAQQNGLSTDEQLATEFRVTLAVRLFEEGRLSMGRAAGMSGMHKADFMDELSRRKVSAINWDDQEIAREFGSGNA